MPLICGKGVLKAYTYLKEEDVWLLQEGEGVVEGFVRVLKKGGAEWRRKREVVAKRREKCMRENVRWVGKFLERMARPPVVVPEKVTVPKTVPVAQ